MVQGRPIARDPRFQIEREPESSWTSEQDAILRAAWAVYGTTSGTAKATGLTRGTVIGRSRTLKLPKRHGGGKKVVQQGPHAIKGTTVCSAKVRDPLNERVLKPGRNSTKLGERVTKGKWKGMPIYSLTLEERATCPRSCKMWLQCYGNNMQFAVRYRHGTALEYALSMELAALSKKYPKGFVVRLHVLGDFYSVDYVKRWEFWLTRYPALRVFGYTSWPKDDPRGMMVASLRDRHWDRFAVRTSGAPDGPRTAVFREGLLAPLKEKDAIVCPAQTGRTASCGTCTLCWATQRPIAFIEH